MKWMSTVQIRYSRRILWLKAGISNNNPRIIAKYFLNYVHSVRGMKMPVAITIACYSLTLYIGVPKLLRTDLGTENSNLAFIQPYLRRNHVDCFSGIDSFRYGKSVSNQVCLFYATLLLIIMISRELKHGGQYSRNGALIGGIIYFW